MQVAVVMPKIMVGVLSQSVNLKAAGVAFNRSARAALFALELTSKAGPPASEVVPFRVAQNTKEVMRDRVRVNGKIKGSGHECPLYTSGASLRSADSRGGCPHAALV